MSRGIRKTNIQDGDDEGKRRREGWLSLCGASIKRVNEWLQRVIGVFCLDLEAD
jgi:hypothetical protein